MTRDEVVATIVDCTEKLGHVPSRNELRKHGHISREHLRRHFGTYTRALEECNLKRRAVGGKLEMEALFLDWAGVVRSLKKLPTVHEYEDGSKYSQRPLLSRFGTWAQVPAGREPLQHQAQEQVRQGKQLVNNRRAPFAPEHIQGKDDRYDNDEFAYQPVGAETPTSGETCK